MNNQEITFAFKLAPYANYYVICETCPNKPELVTVSTVEEAMRWAGMHLDDKHMADGVQRVAVEIEQGTTSRVLRKCPEDDLYACVDGEIYGPCENELCSGVCTLIRTCECPGCESDICCNPGDKKEKADV